VLLSGFMSVFMYLRVREFQKTDSAYPSLSLVHTDRKHISPSPRPGPIDGPTIGMDEEITLSDTGNLSTASYRPEGDEQSICLTVVYQGAQESEMCCEQPIKPCDLKERSGILQAVTRPRQHPGDKNSRRASQDKMIAITLYNHDNLILSYSMIIMIRQLYRIVRPITVSSSVELQPSRRYQFPVSVSLSSAMLYNLGDIGSSVVYVSEYRYPGGPCRQSPQWYDRPARYREDEGIRLLLDQYPVRFDHPNTVSFGNGVIT
jgi:hypothetical protein